MNRQKIHIIIVAAGVGSRFGGAMPKQFCMLDGRPVLMHTVDRMRRALPDASVAVVLSRQMHGFWQELCDRHGFDSPTVVYGGATRSESVRNAVMAIEDSPDIVLVHDGARPLVDADCVRGVVKAMQEGADGAIPVVPVTDSLRVLCDGNTSEAVDRSLFRAVQTPQAFDFAKLSEAYASTDRSFSDDASLMEHCGHSNFVLTQGSETNIKITNPIDLAIAQLIMHSEKA